MTADRSVYQNPLLERYASKEMLHLFSPEYKHKTWRRLWIDLAEAEKAQGYPITDAQIRALKDHADDIDWDFAAAKEKEVRHDVMAHVHAYAKAAPEAAAIIHLGATSAYVADNTDLIQMREGLKLLRTKILAVLDSLRTFARTHRALPALGYTHFQPAQPVTVGKRACLWMQDLLLDVEEFDFIIRTLPFRGAKGTTGTQASFLTLFQGDHGKVKAVDEAVTRANGFARSLAVTGQTYTRKLDARMTAALSALAQSASKFAMDLRLLQHLKEIEEPFEKNQIGSSAMAYKRNPMRCERMGSLARFVMAQHEAAAYTASTQWMERTLDDSANKRLAVAQAFLAADAILEIMGNVTAGLVVYPGVIRRHLEEELPFMMTEEILMEGVRRGGDRQALHEEIRQLSMAAAEDVKVHGKPNSLLERIAAHAGFGLRLEELKKIADPSRYVGRAPEQVDEFLRDHVDPLLEGFTRGAAPELKV